MTKHLAVLALLSVAFVACGVDTAPYGLRATPAGEGPTVVFDLTRRPLPEIPQPNDVATVADPTSRTGRRLNVSLVAPTAIEQEARDGFNDMEGWGTFAPLTVSFAKELGQDDRLPALDLRDLRARMQNDGYDFSNDAVYVVNLKTGLPVPLDLGEGSFPVAVVDPSLYWANDPHANEHSIVFETREEGPGLSQVDYRPELDTDFDGVLDHPNTMPDAPLSSGKIRGIDDVLTWYERESDTLILRPVVPMEEKTEYAVVLTDRLRGPDGKPVRSPFPFVHHPTQKDAISRLQQVLGDKGRANYFGDIAGSGLDHVAFAWSFTTQPTYEDLRLLRDGLYGQGPFAHLHDEYPPTVTTFPAVGLSRDPDPSDRTDPRCVGPAKTPYIVKVADAKGTIHDLLNKLVDTSPSAARELEASIVDNVDHIALGSFKAPYYLGDPQHEQPSGRFHLNFTSGTGDVHTDTVPFWFSVPKAAGGKKQPFDVVVWSHGFGQSALEIVARAGFFAKQGLAMIAINFPGHGPNLSEGTQELAEVFLRQSCQVPWVTGVAAGRAYDLNGDGELDPGGLLFSAHVFHSRDSIRQSVLDQLMTSRVVRSFDGKLRSTEDYNADGVPDLAGDFDGDGVPDAGGETTRIFAAGDSFGGIITQIFGALDPYVVAAGPISGGGGVTDIATRSSLIPAPVIEQVITPLVVAVPSEERAPDANGPQTVCAAGEKSVRFVVNDLTNSREVEIACLSAAELDIGKTVLVTNIRTRAVECARTTAAGRFRVPVAASVGDRLDIQIYDAPDAVDSYKTCNLTGGAPAGRRIRTWEKPSAQPVPVADDRKTCDSDTGCAQYRDVFFAVGDDLVSPQEGYGYQRQSPEFRRFINLAQAAIDPADSINYAPYYMLRPIPGTDGKPLGARAILTSNTVGDPIVPEAAGNAFARAVGALPFMPPSAATTYPELADYATPQALYDTWAGKTPNEILIDNYGIEGIAGLGRTHGGPGCSVNYGPSSACTDPAPATDPNVCQHALFDADWHSEGTDHYDASHLDVPLRLTRLAQVRAGDATSLNQSWAPRLIGVPLAPDDMGWKSTGPLVGLVNAYVNPIGQHVWALGNPCKSFDDAIYFDHMLARFLATSGQDAYFLSHPTTHHCLGTQTCPFFP